MQNSSAQNGPKRLKNIALEWSWEATKYTSQATLVVDDFGVKYVGEEHVHHLVGVLAHNKQYEITADWKGNKYIGITLDWDYK